MDYEQGGKPSFFAQERKASLGKKLDHCEEEQFVGRKRRIAVCQRLAVGESITMEGKGSSPPIEKNKKMMRKKKTAGERLSRQKLTKKGGDGGRSLDSKEVGSPRGRGERGINSPKGEKTFFQSAWEESGKANQRTCSENPEKTRSSFVTSDGGKGKCLLAEEGGEKLV